MRTKKFLGLILLFLVFGIYSIGDKTLYADDINDLNTIIKQKVVDENHSLNDNIAHTSTIKNVDYLNFGNSLSDYSSNQVGKISTISAEEPSTIVNYHTSEEYINGSFRINFWIDSIIGIPPAAITAQISFLTEPTLHGPVSVQNSEMLTKEVMLQLDCWAMLIFLLKQHFLRQLVPGEWWVTLERLQWLNTIKCYLFTKSYWSKLSSIY